MLQGMLEVLVEYPEEDQSRLHSDLPPVEIHEPLCQPQRWIVATDVVGVDYRYLKAKSNDHVIVYGWKRGNRDAVAFNERNHSSGWIPSQYLHSKESVQARGESFVARQNLRSKPESNQYLQWKVGERIRVCHWINRKSYRGIGYNLKTGQIGQFAISDWNCAVEDDT